MGDGLNLESFRYSDSEVAKPNGSKVKRRLPSQNAFIRGPMPLGWFIRAANIPRRNALVVSLVLWYLAGLRSERVGLVLCVNRCEPFGLGRKAVERGLRDLEVAKLIRVDRQVGKCPRVDLLQVD
jgi:hypothetical protein